MNKPHIYTFINTDLANPIEAVSDACTIQYSNNFTRIARVNDKDVKNVSSEGILITPKSNIIENFIDKLCKDETNSNNVAIPYYDSESHQLTLESNIWEKVEVLTNGFKFVKLIN